MSLCRNLKLLIQTDLFFLQEFGPRRLLERLKIRILHARSSGIDEGFKEESIASLDWSSASGLDDDSSVAPAGEGESNGNEASASHNPVPRGDQEPEIEVFAAPEEPRVPWT